MLRPRDDEVDAFLPLGYLPGWGGPSDVEDEPQDRASVIAAAREDRLQQPGLAVDDATLERVADAVMAPDYLLPGLYLTDEEVHDEVPEVVCEAVLDYLEARPGVSGGRRMGYVDGHRVMFVRIVGELEPHATALRRLSDRIVIEPATVSEDELEAIVERIGDEYKDLSAIGIGLTGWGATPERGIVELDVIAADHDEALRVLTERYGPLVRIGHWDPTWHYEQPHDFGSWSSEGLELEIYYGLPPHPWNTDEPLRCDVVEHEDRVVVTAIIRRKHCGLEVGVGTDQFRAIHASARLAAPVGDRVVIDGSTGERRPSLAELRARAG